MSSDRCPACAAAIPVGAPWCTLCFADLRPAPPEPEPIQVAEQVRVAEQVHQPVAVSVGAASAAPDLPLAPDPILDAPVMRAPSIAGNRAAGWPCDGCGAQVPIAEPNCPDCGTAFLATARSRPSFVLPGVGDVTELDGGGKMKLIIGGGLGVCLLLFLLYVVIGSLV